MHVDTCMPVECHGVSCACMSSDSIVHVPRIVSLLSTTAYAHTSMPRSSSPYNFGERTTPGDAEALVFDSGECKE
jgi:hypothetical protein